MMIHLPLLKPVIDSIQMYGPSTDQSPLKMIAACTWHKVPIVHRIDLKSESLDIKRYLPPLLSCLRLMSFKQNILFV